MGRDADPRTRICLPLDVNTLNEAENIVRELLPFVGLFKIGFELFVAEGPKAVDAVHQLGGEVFLDLKFHDIPNTVAAAARRVAEMGVRMFNVHSTGGPAMMRAAVEAAHAQATRPPAVLAVTVLTSLSQEDLSSAIGMCGSVQDNVVRLAKMAQTCGAAGVVASPQEARLLRQCCGHDFIIVTPGVRPTGISKDDQKRVMTPAEAIAAGASVLVIGRPILAALDRRAAAASILEEVRLASSSPPLQGG